MTNPKPSPIRLSISTRLTLWYGTTLFLLLSVFTVFCYSSFHVSLHRDYDRHLTHEERELAQYVRLEDGQPKFAPLSELRSVAYQTDGTYGTYVRLFSAGGETLYTSPNWAGHQSLAVAIPGTAEQKTVSRTWEDKPARSRYAPLLDDDGSLAGWLEVTGFEWSLHQELRRLGRFRARLVPPAALSVDASQETRDGLIPLLAGGRCEFEFDTSKRNGKAADTQPPPPPGSPPDEEAGLVN